MIILAQSKVNKTLTNNPNTPIDCKFLQMDACNLKFEDGTLDMIISNMVMMLVDSPEMMIKEAFRVLKPGSLAAFSVWGRKEKSLGIRIPQMCVADISKKYDLNMGTPTSTGKDNF
mmetsp:Transcript_45716/g.38526  ORF Transcript_45716/g.38526 Transcript_45716/m.38526 type:complete len:116 (-) Transcript_45716:371-718(-)